MPVNEKANPYTIREVGYCPHIEPLKEFDLRSSQPSKHRPFKPIYYITMGLCPRRVPPYQSPWGYVHYVGESS